MTAQAVSSTSPRCEYFPGCAQQQLNLSPTAKKNFQLENLVRKSASIWPWHWMDKRMSDSPDQTYVSKKEKERIVFRFFTLAPPLVYYYHSIQLTYYNWHYYTVVVHLVLNRVESSSLFLRFHYPSTTLPHSLCLSYDFCDWLLKKKTGWDSNHGPPGCHESALPLDHGNPKKKLLYLLYLDIIFLCFIRIKH